MAGFNVWQTAWRNVWRNSRRSTITIIAIAFALVVTTLYSGMIAGYLADMERGVLDYEIGDLQIFAADYQRKPSIYSDVKDADAVVSRLEQAGFRASARYLAGGLAAAGDSSAGVSIRGVDPVRDLGVSKLGLQLADGVWLDDAAPREVVVGKRLARTLGIAKGAEVVVLTQAADGSTANQLYKVRGVLKGIGDGTDRGGFFMTVGAFRELMVYQGGAHQILVRRPAALSLDAAAVRARALAPGLDVSTWKQILPTLATMLDAAHGAGLVMSFIIYLAIGIVILNAMLMAVFERVRELGVLKAIGMGPWTVLWMVLLESLMQAAVAVVIGLALAAPLAWYLAAVGIDQGKLANVSTQGIARSAIWRGEFTPQTFIGSVLMLLSIVTCAVIYPAIKAARLRPIEAMRHQ